MEDATGIAIKRLERDHPGWMVWVVRRYKGGPVWCAAPHGEAGPKTINAHSAAAPEEYIKAAQS